MDDIAKTLQTTKDINVEIRVRNNRILTAMKKAGISVKQLAEGTGVTITVVYDFINMKLAARKEKNDEWLPAAVRIADFFYCLPEDLFSDVQQRRAIARNRVRAEISFAEMQTFFHNAPRAKLEIECEANEARGMLYAALLKLTPREERVLRMRFGINLPRDMTLESIGEQLNLSGDRIRIIESRALRKLQHPAWGGKIRSATCSQSVEVATNWQEDREIYTHFVADDEVLSQI